MRAKRTTPEQPSRDLSWNIRVRHLGPRDSLNDSIDLLIDARVVDCRLAPSPAVQELLELVGNRFVDVAVRSQAIDAPLSGVRMLAGFLQGQERLLPLVSRFLDFRDRKRHASVGRDESFSRLTLRLFEVDVQELVPQRFLGKLQVAVVG